MFSSCFYNAFSVQWIRGRACFALPIPHGTTKHFINSFKLSVASQNYLSSIKVWASSWFNSRTHWRLVTKIWLFCLIFRRKFRWLLSKMGYGKFQHYSNLTGSPLLIPFNFSISTPIEYGFSILYDQLNAASLDNDSGFNDIVSFVHDCKLNAIAMDEVLTKFKETTDPKYVAVVLLTTPPPSPTKNMNKFSVSSLRRRYATFMRLINARSRMTQP